MKSIKIIVAVAFMVLISSFAINQVGNSNSDSGYAIGDAATDFKLRNIDDSFVSLSDYPEAKGFIIIFTCNHCPYSVAYEDRIIALDQKYKSQGYPVIAINPNNPKAYPEDSFEKMKERAASKQFTFPYLFDEDQTIYPIYGATKTPHVYLLKKENNALKVKYIGAIDNNYKNALKADQKYVEDAVGALLSGKAVPVETTRAIGCSIKS
ncbi:thioredoxin family protein [Aquimarina sp. 2-A2]|uniref:thioredoxin family protein n=1 Tax=Aquimarina sp. 2-A2 TaxID=3382644 RepID=UPI00387EF019